MAKEVLITGSSRGIGKACAIYLAKNGFDIVLHCNKNISKAEEVLTEIKEIGVNGRILQFDVKDRNTCRKVISNDITTHGCYYGTVLNAGIAKDNVFPIMEDEEWDDVINTNLGGFYNILKPIVMAMIEDRIKGRIIAMSSISGLKGNRGQVNYSASKAGIIGAVKALSLELAKRKITVNAIAPGIIDTDMIQDIPQDEIGRASCRERV